MFYRYLHLFKDYILFHLLFRKSIDLYKFKNLNDLNLLQLISYLFFFNIEYKF